MHPYKHWELISSLFTNAALNSAFSNGNTEKPILQVLLSETMVIALTEILIQELANTYLQKLQKQLTVKVLLNNKH